MLPLPWRVSLLVLLGAAIGGFAGWHSTEPLYQAAGVVAVPSVHAPSTALPPCPWRRDPASALASDLVTSRRMTLIAMEQDAWRGTGEEAGASAVQAFEARRGAAPLALPPRVIVTFQDRRPAVALAGVGALLAALELFYRDLDGEREADGGLVVEDRGALPTEPFRDTRSSAAVVGAGAGALLGLLLTWLLARRRTGGAER